MASTNEINEQKQSKLELSQPQLNSLVSATGMTEEKIREIAGEIRAKFPSDGLTLNQFYDIYSFSDEEVSPSPKMQRSAHLKLLFELLDQSHSGKIDLYDYILGAVLLEKNDPQLSMKSLFQLCDSNHNGLLTYSDIKNVLSDLFKMSTDNDVETTEQNEDPSPFNKIMTVVREAFGDNTQISEQTFAKLCTENEELKQIADMLNENLAVTLSYATGKFSS